MVTATVHQPVLTVNSTPAAVFRSITEEPPTLLVDEADTIFGSPKDGEKNEEMRGLLNAGHQRDRYVLRVVGNDHTPRGRTPSPWRPSLASGTCPTRSWTARS